MSTFTKNSKLSIQNRVKKRLELLLEKKSKIITFLALGILLGLIITLLLPKRYRATSSLSLEFNSYNNELLKNSGNLDNIISLVNSTEFLNKEKKL